METNLLARRRFVFVSHLDFNLYRFRLPIMKTLVERGARVAAVCPSGKWAARFPQEGIQFVPWEVDRRSLHPVHGWKDARHLQRILRTLKPDLVHTFTLRPALYGGLAHLMGIGSSRWVASITGLGSLYIEQNWRQRVVRLSVEHVLRLTLSRADRVIFQNSDDRETFLLRRLCAPERTALIRGSGIDTTHFRLGAVSQREVSRLRQRWGIPEDALVVVMIARLIRAKGVEEFVHVARHLGSPHTFFVLVGEPDPGNPDTIPENQVASWRQIPFLLLPGFQEDVRPWLAVSAVYVLPSWREGLPRTVLEAMAMGLPVVATDIPGCRDAVRHGKTGLLVPPKDVESLERALAMLLQNKPLRLRMGMTGRERAERQFAIEKIVASHLALYQSLLQ